MNENERFQISQLEGKARDIEAKAQREGRQLLQAERDLRDELIQTATDIRMKLPANAPLTLQGPNSGSHGYTRSGLGSFSSLGEFLLTVRSAGLPGGQTDQRLFQAAASGLNETVPSDGGFLVQQDFSNALLENTFAQAVVAPRCWRIPISGNSNSIKLAGIDETSRVSTRSGGILGYWEEEAAQKTESKPKFRKIELNLKKLIGLCYATDELLQDAAVLNSVIPQAFASEFAFRLDDAIINGTGAGQPLGILNAGCLASVAKETGQKKETLVAENVIKMYSRLLPGREKNAVWLANKNILPQLLTMSLAVGTGGVPLYMPMNQLQGAPFQMLMGLPVLFCEQCPSLGTAGDIILADLGGGYVLAEKGGIQSDMSIHVRFVYDESVFRFVLRVDGQPVRASALTPYKGSETQSHFVVTADRIV